MLGKLLAILLFTLALQTQAQTLKASDFDSDPWKHHPDFSPLATSTDRQFALHLASSLRYHTFPLLMPMQYRLLTSRHDQKAQSFVDQAMSRILKTPTGQEICQQVTNGSVSRIAQIFGFTETAASAVRDGCTALKPVQLPVTTLRPREYVFVHSSQLESPVEGWTTPHNVSYIFMTDADFNEEFIFRVLAHETAIKLDLKEQWGWTGDLSTLAEKMGVRYDGANSCGVQYAIRHPLVKYSLSVLRAMVIETKILNELGLVAQGMPATVSCTEQVTSLLPSLARMGALLKYEKSYLQFQTRNCTQNSELNLAAAIEILQNEKVFNLATQTETSLCEFLRTPYLSSMAFGPFAGGPRPRIGPWAQKSLILKDQSAKKKTETLNKMDLLIDDEPKSQAQTDNRLKKLLDPQSEERPSDLRQKLRDDDDDTKKN